MVDADFARELERDLNVWFNDFYKLRDWMESYAYGEAGFEKAEVIGNMKSARELLDSVMGSIPND